MMHWRYFDRISRLGIWILAGTLSAAPLLAQAAPLETAQAAYRRTQYKQARSLLESLPKDRAAVLLLLGKVYYGLGEYKSATQVLDDAAKLQPNSSDIYLWLGRAYGRRAETSNFLTAPRHAAKTHRYLERALQLDSSNQGAADDLLEYYLQAPGFLGGGRSKAEALARQMMGVDAERAWARIAEDQEDFAIAEQHLRKAIELDRENAGLLVKFAQFLARRGRIKESDHMFAEAALLAPTDPEVAFARARTYIEQERNLNEARDLLNAYIEADLTPENPSRQEAREWLEKAL